MSNKPLKLTIATELRERLEAIAVQLERSVQDTANLALTEFVDNWDEYMRKIEILDSDAEKRAVLRAIND